MTDVVHRCLSKRDCVNLTGDREPAATTKPDTLCYGCIKQIQGYLARLPHLLEALRTSLARPIGGGGSGARVSGSKEPPAPFNVNVDAAICETLEVVQRAGGWKIRIHDLVSRSAEPFTVWRRGVRTEDWPLTGCDRALDIRRVHKLLDRMTGFTPVWHRKPGLCPGCGLGTLGSLSGTDYVQCSNSACAISISLDEYEEVWLDGGKKDLPG